MWWIAILQYIANIDCNQQQIISYVHRGKTLMYTIYGKFSVHCLSAKPSTLLLSFFLPLLPESHSSVSHLPLYFKINMKIGFLDAKMNTHTYQHSLNTLTVCGYCIFSELASVWFGSGGYLLCRSPCHSLYFIFLLPPFCSLSAHLQLVSRIVPIVCGLAIERWCFHLANKFSKVFMGIITMQFAKPLSICDVFVHTVYAVQ